MNHSCAQQILWSIYHVPWKSAGDKATNKTDKEHPDGWLIWLERRPVHLASSPGQGIYLGCGFDPQMGHVPEAIDRCFSLSFSLLISLLLSLSLKLINISSGEDFKKNNNKEFVLSETLF